MFGIRTIIDQSVLFFLEFLKVKIVVQNVNSNWPKFLVIKQACILVQILIELNI